MGWPWSNALAPLLFASTSSLVFRMLSVLSGLSLSKFPIVLKLPPVFQANYSDRCNKVNPG